MSDPTGRTGRATAPATRATAPPMGGQRGKSRAVPSESDWETSAGTTRETTIEDGARDPAAGGRSADALNLSRSVPLPTRSGLCPHRGYLPKQSDKIKAM